MSHHCCLYNYKALESINYFIIFKGNSKQPQRLFAQF